MKILQLVQKPQRRGAEMFAFQLCEELERQGHLTSIVYLYPPPNDHSLPIRDCDFVIGENEYDPSEKFPGWNKRILAKIKEIAESFHPDVIQLNAARTLKYGTLLKRWYGNGKWALVYRNIGDPNVWMHKTLYRWIYRNFLVSQLDGIIAVSRVSYRTLISFYGNRYRLVKIPRGIDTENFTPKQERLKLKASLDVPTDAPVLIYVGSLTLEKRPDRALRVFEMAHRSISQLHFWILGEGVMKEQLREFVLSHQLDHCVRFLGAQEDVASYMNCADLLLLTSDTEGIPGVVLEAATLAVPAVATNVGGVEDCILDHETGRLILPGNEDQFATTVEELIRFPESRRKMGDRARQFVMENFGIRRIAERYVLFYQQLLGPKGYSQIGQ